ncbi:unnamed protein product [Acanthosepion pharaonis]|uniref:Uncharacterized protein n=1 Tax=Acanthosepion pharaonis TaxID=158019 RepID=A0A812D0J4_ACAPH|nr:unnamed protein product [Sepia pharaonis]
MILFHVEDYQLHILHEVRKMIKNFKMRDFWGLWHPVKDITTVSVAVPDAPVQFLNENYKSLPQELKKWSTADVVRWLDQRGLAEHFAVIFHDSLKDISIENRESLLSSIYELLNPTSIQLCLHHHHVHLLSFGILNGPTMTTIQTVCVKVTYHWMREMSLLINNWGAASISRNVTRQVSLYELLGLERRREVCCIQLCQPENSDFNFSVETTDQGYILVDDPKDLDLNHGDRILEVNGVYICNENDLKKAIKHSTCLNMVVVRSEKNTTVAESSLNQPQINETPPESKNLKNQVCELRSKVS